MTHRLQLTIDVSDDDAHWWLDNENLRGLPSALGRMEQVVAVDFADTPSRDPRYSAVLDVLHTVSHTLPGHDLGQHVRKILDVVDNPPQVAVYTELVLRRDGAQQLHLNQGQAVLVGQDNGSLAPAWAVVSCDEKQEVIGE